MRLNKFLANAGVASRRESEKLIQAALVEVNGTIVTDPAFNVEPDDNVIYNGRKVQLSTKEIVILLNKPKGFITTAQDTHGRKTVLDLIPLRMRLFPVGRLDKDTTGLLLLTNDGELANYLMHPRNSVPKIYEAEIEGRISEKDIKKIQKGVFIGEGLFGRAEVLSQHTDRKRTTVRLKLHHGKKREIRRIFEFLDYKLFSLTRTGYGNLTLESVEPGKWRFLTPEEIKNLRHAGR